MQQRPHRVRSHKKLSPKATFEQLNHGSFMVVNEDNEVVKPPLASRGEVTVPSGSARLVQKGTRNAVNEVKQYSQEMITHLNFLRESKGESMFSDGSTVSISPVVSNIISSNKGPIEKAIDEANEKVRFYRKEQIRIDQEVQRWSMVAEQLQNAYSLLSGQVQPKSKGDRISTSERIDWRGTFTTRLASGPKTMKEFRKELETAYPEQKDVTIYQSIVFNIRKGFLLRDKQTDLLTLAKPEVPNATSKVINT